ncbi:MAG TPA: hypothetical protein VFO76_00075, partial [Candidatus Kapabacteria bacterium]|nr:hypothetical protein [Candidatus Kapabacteria bacterium]
SKLIESLNSGTIDGIPALYGKRFSNILNEYNVNKMGTWNKITFLSDALNFQIELCEKKAFETRNRLAHGTFLNPYEGNFDQNQKELDNLGYVTNLFNKLVLRMAGYIGNYVNYSNNWAVDKLG